MSNIEMVKVKSTDERRNQNFYQDSRKMILSLKKAGLSIRVFNDIDVEQLNILLRAMISDGY